MSRDERSITIVSQHGVRSPPAAASVPSARWPNRCRRDRLSPMPSGSSTPYWLTQLASHDGMQPPVIFLLDEARTITFFSCLNIRQYSNRRFFDLDSSDCAVDVICVTSAGIALPRGPGARPLRCAIASTKATAVLCALFCRLGPYSTCTTQVRRDVTRTWAIACLRCRWPRLYRARVPHTPRFDRPLTARHRHEDVLWRR